VRAAVVGAGVMGLATAAALARRGHEVEVHEQFGLDHTRGSSHGRSRIFRLLYWEPEWIAMAQEALAAWRTLERETDEDLIVLEGLLEVGETSEEALDASGVEWEALSSAEVERRYGVRADGPVLLQPEAGYVRADRARNAFLEVACRQGADVRERSRVGSLDELAAHAVVVTAGAWARELLREHGGLEVTVSRETVVYFRLDQARIPSLIERGRGPGELMYAVRDPHFGLKAGAHGSGAAARADEEGAADAQVVEAVSAWVAERFPAAVLPPAAVETCLYTSTADESFVLERRGRIVVGSACSGHGFKFAPVVGARLASLAVG
jgi:glycine/D-amino acid oxidase-like deaminating enzyme